MIVHETTLPGVHVLEPDRKSDERGYFARIWDPAVLAAGGLNTRVAQVSVSFNQRKGTLRGLHYQAAPMEEAKIVRCIRGGIFDVAVDIRPGSATCGQWVGVELSAENGRGLYIPEGFAHGFQTLVDDSEVLYFISQDYSAAHARGVRWDDPVFGIVWPEDRRTMNERDRTYPDFIIDRS